MNWLTLKENDRYEISDTGLVRRKYTMHILNGCITSGYKTVKLTFNNSQQRRFYVHRLVAEHFIINPDPVHKTIVNHKDGNKLNNTVENLEWVTPRENNLHYYLTQKPQKKHFQQPIPVVQYDLQHNKIAEFSSMSRARKATGVSVVQIARCIHGEVSQANGFIWEAGSTTTQEENPHSSARNILSDEDIV